MFHNRLRAPILTGMRSKTFVLALLLVAATPMAGEAGGNDGAVDGTRTLSGRITAEGMECLAFRDEAGALYTLQGDL